MKRPAVLFPGHETTAMTVCRILAAFAGWLGVLLIAVSAALALVLGVTGLGGADDHGGSALVLGGAVAGACLVAGAHVIPWLEDASTRGARIAGAALLVLGAWLCAFYPVAWLRDSYSLPAVAALVFAVLCGLQLIAAWSLLTSSKRGGR